MHAFWWRECRWGVFLMARISQNLPRPLQIIFALNLKAFKFNDILTINYFLDSIYTKLVTQDLMSVKLRLDARIMGSQECKKGCTYQL